MTIQFGLVLRNAIADVYESTIGVSPLLRIYTGAMPATPATAASGTLLAELSLPSDWLSAASAGVKTLAGTWSVAAAVGAGTAGYYRITNTAGTVTHEQGTVSATGGGGDLTLDNAVIAVGQQVIINTFTRTAPNA